MCRGYIIDFEDAKMIKEQLCYVGYVKNCFKLSYPRWPCYVPEFNCLSLYPSKVPLMDLKAPFIWRKVVPGRRVTRLAEPTSYDYLHE